MKYNTISQYEAKRMMDDGDVIILDVRTREEYESGHIKDAVLLPNENIENEKDVNIENKDAVILVYCRSGNRSKQAAGKLASYGYTNVYEFGGISSWEYETVK